MTIPPFPQQDLAKLVLGYLAEEQLMTAYDEFLQASPYLDALRNEYDRIFMTSLKNILAEYRAVKIYVDTCKPFILRKRLFQCANLFEIVKLLVQFVDINKLNAQDRSVDKSSCNPCTPSMGQVEATSLESSVETTALADLPGNATLKKKCLKVLDRDQRNMQTVAHLDFDDRGQTHSSDVKNVNTEKQLVVDESYQKNNNHVTNNVINEAVKSKKAESVQKIEEFDNILDFVCKNVNDTNNKTPSVTDKVIDTNRRISTAAATFQDFTTGLHSNNKSNMPVSTAGVDNAQAPPRRTMSNTFVNIGTVSTADLKSNNHLVFKVGNITNNFGIPTITSEPPSAMDQKSQTQYTRDENKIKILSDVKVDKSYESICGRPKMPIPRSNATSTPQVPMQTIVINGVPAYKHRQANSSNCYTKDEIMAMPTIILVPATGPKQNALNTEPAVTDPVRDNVATTSCAENILKPLVIDVTSDISVPDVTCSKDTKTMNNKPKVLNEQSLVKTIEVPGHVSVPKDNTFSTALKTTTPQCMPPKRKSSSTPRRTSHVRVLDFTTPRRILHETINEQSSNKNSSTETETSENPTTQIKQSAEIEKTFVVTDNLTNSINITSIKSDSAKENKVVFNKKSNWDADLRALIAKDIENSSKTAQKTKSKSKTNNKKKNIEENKADKCLEDDSKMEKKSKKGPSKVKSNKNKKNKDNRDEIEEDTSKKKESPSIPVKPTINIITNNEWNTNQECDKNTSKNNTSHERIDTPECERIALQNAIGAKLNLSDFLETPFKQALYDIQMDTPKYLGPDLPDEPISEVKIMSIPTPRFLCSPKAAQATPSTYSSRPTDYSSGGSYYKPDDQDYVISTEILECAVSLREKTDASESCEEARKTSKVEEDNEESKSRRPVRQCRKNVSYYKNSNISKTKELEENLDGSDSVSVNSSYEKVDNTNKKVKGTKRKSDITKKRTSQKKLKSPLKRELPKTFMKIKPRRTTPVKESLGGKSRKLSDSISNKTQKRVNTKDSNITPVTASVPTKSRRKSSTPRKLHCTKTFNSQRSDIISPESDKSKQSTSQESQVCSHDSDIEQLPLRWSDDGSQDAKSQDAQPNRESIEGGDDLTKIKEYIETSVNDAPLHKEGEGPFHVCLLKRGFDVQTARSIERDLLDSPNPKKETATTVVNLNHLEVRSDDPIEGTNNKNTSDTSVNLEIVDTDDDDDEIELSEHECNEDTSNFITHEYIETNLASEGHPAKLKDNYSMEICIDDGVTVRLRATTFSMLLDQDPGETDVGYSFKETEIAVSSISNIDRLYTPMKDPRQQVYEIFDSTLTSLDTPFKAPSPKSQESEPMVNEIELDVEKIDCKDKDDLKKRKRLQSSSSIEESPNCSKKQKSETQYLLNTANIQNIDIESVLSKLHGP